MLILQNVSLNRLNTKIFEDISFTLGAGRVLILKGKNGSGKTSLIKTILYLLEPSSGSIYWKGKILPKTIYDFYNNITYIGDRPTSLKQLTIEENIKIWKKISISEIDYEKIRNVLTILKLNNYKNKKVNTLSLGEIKKLELLRLIIENKKYWLLDEPFTNLDLDSIDIIRQTFEEHCKNEGSVLFSSHQDMKFSKYQEIRL